MNDLEQALRILRGSKQYNFNGTVLTVIGYYTGKRISLDLVSWMRICWKPSPQMRKPMTAVFGNLQTKKSPCTGR